MDKKKAKEHLIFIRKAINDFGYDCMDDFEAIKDKYKNNGYHTNQELYNATSRMMCKARHATV